MSVIDDPRGTGGERTLVAAVEGAGGVHAVWAYHGEPDAAGTSLGSCCCGWGTEGWAPAAMVWPACRAHALAVRR